MSVEKKLVIDCQVFQTSSWHRGMGKYSLALLDALLAERELRVTYKPYFIFNDSLQVPEAVETMLAKADQGTIIRLPLKLPREPRNEHSVEEARLANKSIFGHHLPSYVSGAFDYMILALYLDEVCPVFPDNAEEKLLIYYDAIPHLYYERYNKFAGFFDNFYYPHTATVYEATKLLAISKTVANDLTVTFGFPAERIHVINGAPIPREELEPDIPCAQLLKSTRYILMPTGQELRKNNKRAVEGFSLFNQSLEKKLRLVITSHFTEEGRKELQAISRDIVFTGNVSESEIDWLYQNCEALLFPSEYEGLGLPVLEGVCANKPIACSDISVFREISHDAFEFFNPFDTQDIATALRHQYDADGVSPKAYRKIKQRYTWQETARASLVALRTRSPGLTKKVKRLKVAIFCPDPAGFSAIGKVVIESHAWYAEYFDITYYFDRGPNHKIMRPNPLPALVHCRSAEDVTAADLAVYDATIYHIGNSEYHLNTLHVALAVPGYVILHDTFLQGAYNGFAELGYISSQRFELEKKLDGLTEATQSQSTFLVSLINNQHGIIAHSGYAKRAIKERLFNKNVSVRQANLPVSVPVFPETVYRPVGSVTTIAFAGILASVKGIDVMEEIATSEEFNECQINIFGYSAVEPEQVNKLRNLPHVRLVTSPSDHEFQTLMRQTDILINVRLAYRGETSLTTLEAMRYGAVVFVRAFGWYDELPDDVVIKLDDPYMTMPKLSDTVRNPEGCQQIGERAVRHIALHHKHKTYAQTMYELIINVKNQKDETEQ